MEQIKKGFETNLKEFRQLKNKFKKAMEEKILEIEKIISEKGLPNIDKESIDEDGFSFLSEDNISSDYDYENPKTYYLVIDKDLKIRTRVRYIHEGDEYEESTLDDAMEYLTFYDVETIIYILDIEDFIERYEWECCGV